MESGKLRTTGVNAWDFAVQCCRDAYDAFALGYQESGAYLSDVILEETIPGSVYTIAMANGWMQAEKEPIQPARITAAHSQYLLRPDPSSIESAANFYKADPPYGILKTEPPPEPPKVSFGSHQVSEHYRTSFIAQVFAGRIEHWKFVRAPHPPRVTAEVLSPPRDATEIKDAKDPIAEERSALMVAFKAKGREQRIRITDEMVAMAAKPGKWNTRSMVTWWKRNDARCQPPHDRLIRSVLAKDPASIWSPK